MTTATVVAEIARLDALSRERELTDRESWHLQKMMTVRRRYRSRPAKEETACHVSV